MLRAYDCVPTDGISNLFDGHKYFDIGQLIGDYRLTFGLVPLTFNFTSTPNVAKYQMAKITEGFTLGRITKHFDALTASPLINVGIDENANLVFYGEPIRSKDYPNDITKRPAPSETPAFQAKARHLITWFDEMGWSRTTAAYRPWAVRLEKMEFAMEQFSRVFECQYSNTPRWNWLLFGLIEYGSDGGAQYYNTYGPWWIEFQPTALATQTLRLRNNQASTYFDFPNTLNLGDGLPKEAFAVDYVVAKQTELLTAYLPSIANLYRAVNPDQVAKTDDEIATILKAIARPTLFQKGVPLYLGQLRCVGRPLCVTNFYHKVPLAQLPACLGENPYLYHRGVMSRGYYSVTRDLVALMVDEYSKTITDVDKKAAVRSVLTTIRSNNAKIKAVLYGTELDLTTSILDSGLNRAYVQCKQGMGGSDNIMKEHLIDDLNYEDIHKILETRKIADILVNFDYKNQETPKVFSREEQVRIDGMGYTLKVKAVATATEITEITNYYLDDVEITEAQYVSMWGAPDLIYRCVNASNAVISLDLLAKFKFGVDTWADALANAVTESTNYLSPRQFVFDSTWCTVDGYPDAMAVDPAYAGQCIIAFAGCTSQAVNQIVKFGLLLCPLDKDFPLATTDTRSPNYVAP